jgi:ParB-like chromosome segregation protein Spo0J
MATTTDTAKLVPAEVAQQIADQAAAPDVTPLTETRVFNLLAAASYTDEEIGEMTGRRACYVGWRLDLLKLSQSGQDALNSGDLPINLAWHIARLSGPNQNLMVARWARGEFSSSRHAERYAECIYRDENSGLLA